MDKRLRAGMVMTALAVIAGCGGSNGDTSALVMPQVVGKRLDIAKSDIERVGIDDEAEIVGGGTFGVVKESNWTVCEQLPAAGEGVKDTPRLTVDRTCPEPHDSDTTEAAPSSTATTTAPATTRPATKRTLTIQNSADLAALLAGTDCGDTVGAFVDTYRGRTIEFDGNIANMASHNSAESRYDILVYAGDYSETSAQGPNFQFRDVGIFDLHLKGENDAVGQGTNLHIVAQVEDFDADQCLVLLKAVSTQVR